MELTIYFLTVLLYISILPNTNSQYTRRYRKYRQNSYLIPKDPQLSYDFGTSEISHETGFIPIQGSGSYDYSQDLGSAYHNSVEKPVDEPQEYVPPQSVGAANIPLMPPPAIPVNAVAANVPSSMGAVFLGSGSIGVVSLGNGAYALGSGALGYSDMRGQPRPSANVPVYPRLPATPNLIPAAVQSQPPPPPPPSYPEFTYHPDIGFTSHPVDPNAYENLRPGSAGFGTPLIRPPRPPRQHFATPTIEVLQNQNQYTASLSPQIGTNIPTSSTYSFKF